MSNVKVQITCVFICGLDTNPYGVDTNTFVFTVVWIQIPLCLLWFGYKYLFVYCGLDTNTFVLNVV